MTDVSTQPLVLTLPDGATREITPGTLPRDVVATIGERLLRAAVAVSIDGVVQDLMTPIRAGGALRVLTDRDPESLAVLRHSAAHALATAVRRLRPDAQIGFGPAIEDGFYYDFGVADPFTPEDLAAFEAELRAVAAEKLAFERREVSREEAAEIFRDDPLKRERLADLPDWEVISVYRDGDFVDLCRGPHVPDTGWLRHVRLMSAAAAHWRGDAKNQPLQRIYGTAFFKKDALDAHLHRLEEAKRRDHRVVGKALDLFQFHPIAPGAAFWTPRGTIVYEQLQAFMREVLSANGYDEVKTPLLYHKTLWERSGHWGKYRENMFLVLDNETEEHDFSLKPMNCPSHHVLYGSKRRSYRELPVRYSTQDVLHRNELSGALSGLTRVRQFQQDDAHIYLAESDITDEVRRLVGILNLIYRTFGLTYAVRLSTRPEQSIGDAESWARAEAALAEALASLDLAFTINPGDGAFYGPKIDFAVTDSIGREWQLGTIQLDYAAPERFDLTYVGADNAEHRPVVIHRAIYGSFERFIAILIEHFAGAFPLWLAPEQVSVIPISQELTAYGQQVADALRGAGLRVGFDPASTDDYRVRIRDASVMKVPYMAVLGRREAEAGTVTVRRRGQEKRQETMPLADFVARCVEEVRTRALPHDYVDLGAVAGAHTDGAPAHGGVTNSAPPD